MSKQKLNLRPITHTDRNDVLALSKAVNGIEKLIDLCRYRGPYHKRKECPLCRSRKAQDPCLRIDFPFTGLPHAEFAVGYPADPYRLNIRSEFEDIMNFIETELYQMKLVCPGEKILVLGGIPAHIEGGTNFVKIHLVS